MGQLWAYATQSATVESLDEDYPITISDNFSTWLSGRLTNNDDAECLNCVEGERFLFVIKILQSAEKV